MSVHNETLAYRIVWERAESVAMCQAAAVTASLGPDEHVGLCAGYVGEGRFALAAFHARFRGEAVDHFVLGEQCQRSRRAFDEAGKLTRPALFWPQKKRPRMGALLKSNAHLDVFPPRRLTPRTGRAYPQHRIFRRLIRESPIEVG